jgi:protease-4
VPRLPHVAALLRAWVGLERVARELLRQQRTDRRWRVFFRLAWLGLAVAVAWACSPSARTRRPAPSRTRPWSKCSGEIAAGNEASAELLVAR